LTLGKIIKIVATRCQILRLKCTKFNFGWGSAPDPAGGAYSAPPGPLAGLTGPTSKGRTGEGKGEGKEGMGRGRSLWEGRGRDPPFHPPKSIFLDMPLITTCLNYYRINSVGPETKKNNTCENVIHW